MNQILAFLFLSISTVLAAQPKISFTFDDGVTHDRPGYTFEAWNGMLLDKLDEAQVKAIFFVSGANKTTEKGELLLKSWDARGHKIGNHTYSHPSYNSKNISFENFALELTETDSIINKYDNYIKLFRFPYLKEGDTQEKIDDFRNFMNEKEYKNGHVTIDASDWYIDSRLRKRLKENPDADISGFKAFYLQHIFERAIFYEDLAFKLTGRQINHTLLLHHNLAAALFLNDLIEMFKKKGWEIISANEAYSDHIFNETPRHAGEGLIWALAKDSGKFEELLRYPAEDSRYEKDKMDKLGL